MNGAKANVCALLNRLTLPDHARNYATYGSTGAARVHLSKVNGDTHDIQEEFVSRTPVVDLVQGEHNCDSVRLHRSWTGAERDTNGLGHVGTSSS